MPTSATTTITTLFNIRSTLQHKIHRFWQWLMLSLIKDSKISLGSKRTDEELRPRGRWRGSHQPTTGTAMQQNLPYTLKVARFCCHTFYQVSWTASVNFLLQDGWCDGDRWWMLVGVNWLWLMMNNSWQCFCTLHFSFSPGCSSFHIALTTNQSNDANECQFIRAWTRSYQFNRWIAKYNGNFLWIGQVGCWFNSKPISQTWSESKWNNHHPRASNRSSSQAKMKNVICFCFGVFFCFCLLGVFLFWFWFWF